VANNKKTTINEWYELKVNIHKTLCTTDIGAYLKTPLGPWINDMSQQWTWFKHPHLNILYHLKDNLVRIYTPASSRRSSKRKGQHWYEIRDIMDPTQLPEHVQKVTITNTSRSYTLVSLEGASIIETDPNPPINPLKFHEEESWSFLRTRTLHQVTEEMIKDMATKGIRIVMDGSYKENNSALGIVIERTFFRFRKITTRTTYIKTYQTILKPTYEDEKKLPMRMYLHPGRGDRGSMMDRKPKYLSLKPPHLPFRNGGLNKKIDSFC